MTVSRFDKARKELNILREKYGFDDTMLTLVSEYYSSNPDIKIGSVLKTVRLVSYALGHIGYDQDGINSFFQRNRRIVLAPYAIFRSRLAVFAHFDMLENVLIEHNDYLISDSGVEGEMTAADLYAFLNGRKFKNVGEIKGDFHSMSLEEKAILKSQSPLTKRMIAEFDVEMIESLKSIVACNLFKLKPRTDE